MKKLLKISVTLLASLLVIINGSTIINIVSETLYKLNIPHDYHAYISVFIFFFLYMILNLVTRVGDRYFSTYKGDRDLKEVMANDPIGYRCTSVLAFNNKTDYRRK